MRTYVQCSCRGQVNVNAQLVTQLLQLVHHLGFRWRVASEQGQPREFAVDVVGGGDVGQQHELLYQPGEQSYGRHLNGQRRSKTYRNRGRVILINSRLIKKCILTIVKYVPIWKTNRRETDSVTHLLLSLYW